VGYHRYKEFVIDMKGIKYLLVCRRIQFSDILKIRTGNSHQDISDSETQWVKKRGEIVK